MKSRLTAFVVVLAFLVSLVFLVGVFGVPVYAGAEDSGWIRDRVVANSTTYDEMSPSMATDSNGYLYLASVVKDSQWKLRLYNSTDSGDTWTFMDTLLSSNYEIGSPSIAIDVGDNDNIFITFEHLRDGGDYDIYVFRFIDGAWATFKILGGDNDDRYPSITSEYWNGTSDRVYISYEEVITEDDRDLMFAWSDDDGETWQTEKLLGDGDDEVYCQTSITTAVDRLGNQPHLYIVYKQGADYGTAYDVWVASSWNQGVNWEYIRVYIGYGGHLVNYPSIATVHGGNWPFSDLVFVAWHMFATDTDSDDIYYAYSLNWGRDWSVRRIAAEHGVDEQYPVLTVDGQGSTYPNVGGYIHVAYYRRWVFIKNGIYYYDDIYYKNASHDSPTQWSSAQKVNEYNDARRERPAITTQYRDGGDAYYPCVAWSDDRDLFNYDIYYSTPGASYTIAMDPYPGPSIYVDGTELSVPREFEWIAGYNHTLNAPSPQYGAGGIASGRKYTFLNWSDGGAREHSITAGTTDMTITAYFLTEYWILVEESGSETPVNLTIDGITYELPPGSYWSDWWEKGSTHTISVSSIVNDPTISGKRYVFTAWSGLSTSTSNNITWTAITTGTFTANYKTQHNVTFQQSGSGATVTATIDGASYDLPESFWWDDGSTHTIEVPDLISGDPDTRFVFTQWDDSETNRSRTVTVTAPANYTAEYKTHYQVTFEQSGSGGKPHVTVDGTTYPLPQSFWFDNGSSYAFSYETPVSDDIRGIQYVLTSTSETSPITVTEPMTVTGYYKTQYYLTVNTDPSGLDDPRWSGWYDEDTHADIAVDTPTGGDGVSTQYRFDHWTAGIGIVDPTAPSTQIFMDAPKTATAHYVKQFKFTVTSDHDSPDPSVGDHWIDENDSITASVTSPADESDGTRYRCTGWTGTGSVSSTGTDPSVTFTMTEPSTITWEWIPQYQITFTQSGPEPGRPVTITVNEEPHSGITIYDYSEWFDESLSVAFNITDQIDSATPGTRYVFVNWKDDGGSVITSPQPISAPDTFTAHYETQYQFQLTIDNGGHGITTPTSGNWYWAGEWVTITMGSDTTSNTTDTRYVFDSWTGTGLGSYTGPENPCEVQMNGPITEVANWKTQYGVVFTESGIESGVDIEIEVNGVTHSETTIYNYTEWVDEGSSVTFSIPGQVLVPPDVYWPHTIYDLAEWKNAAGSVITSPQTISAPDTFTAHYTAQYRLAVESPYGTTGGTDYYDRGSTAYATLDTNNVSGPQTGIRYVFTEWSGNASGTDYAQSDPIIMDAPKTAVASWKTQFYLTIDARAFYQFPTPPFGRLIEIDVDIPGEGWYDEGIFVTLTAPSSIPYNDDTRFRFDRWEGDVETDISTDNPITFNMDNPKDVTASYVTQYKFTVISEFGSPVPSAGEHWYDYSTYINASITTTISDEFDGTRYSLEGWNGTGTSTQSYADSWTDTWVYFSLYLPSSIEWNWRIQYQLTIDNGGHGTTTPESGNWYDAGTEVTITMSSDTTSNTTQTRYLFDSWTGTGTGNYTGSENPCQVQMNAPITEVASWKAQYYLTVETDPTSLSPQPIVSPTGPWYDSGTQVNLTAETIEGYKFDHWDIDGTAQNPSANPISLTMDAPHTATAYYTTVAPAFPWWWLGVIVLIIVAATVIFILARKRILRTKTTSKPKPSK